MCTVEKCCYAVPLNIGCVIVGIISFIMSVLMFTASTVYLSLESQGEGRELTQESLHFAKHLGLNLNVSSMHFILSTTIVISLLWMMFSILLIFGILRNNANFVLSHFLFGIVINIISMLTALLVLLQECFILSSILFACSLIYIHFLVVIHTVYDLMHKGKDFRFRRHGHDEDLLVESFDDDLDSL